MRFVTGYLMYLMALLIALPVQALRADTLPETFTARTGSLDDVVGFAGSVQGDEESEARARTGGTLVQVNVARGDRVKKGQVLGLVKDDKTGQQVEGLNVQLQSAEKNLARLKELLPLDAASPAQVEQAEAQLAALKSQRDNAGQNARDGRILAPFDGQFVALKAVSGTVLMPGESMGTVAAFPLRAKLMLPERHARLLNAGDSLALDIHDEGTAGFEGSVVKIWPHVEAGRVTVDVSLPEKALENLTVGQKILARVPTGTRQGIVVPQGFVKVRSGLSFVQVKGAGDVLVQVGYPDRHGMVEVLSGLKDGDVLVRP